MGRSKKVDVEMDPDEYRRLYLDNYRMAKSRWHSEIRASGAKGPNSPERIAEVMSRYSDGVPDEAVEEMVDDIMSDIFRR